MRKALTILLVLAAAAALPAAHAVFEENPWLDREPLNIAHQGGAKEAPSNTLYAFKESLAKGADVLELDVHATKDRQLVVLHDPTLERTTNGTGRVDGRTLAEIKALDAAYWWSPGTVDCHPAPDVTCSWVFRGVATGEEAPPLGYSASDFTIPTLDEVLDAFPGTFINIEIKATAPDTIPYERELAALLAEYGRADDVIVVSFLDHAIEAFKVFAPNVHTATATAETAAYWLSVRGPSPGAPNPRYVALQVPVTFQGVEVVDQAGTFIAKANDSGLAVHVWTIDDPEQMCWILDAGAQGIMTDRPTTLQSILDGTTVC